MVVSYPNILYKTFLSEILKSLNPEPAATDSCKSISPIKNTTLLIKKSIVPLGGIIVLIKLSLSVCFVARRFAISLLNV